MVFNPLRFFLDYFSQAPPMRCDEKFSIFEVLLNKTRILVLLLVTTLVVSAQRGYRFEYGVMTGASNYLGEIGGKDKPARKFVNDVKLLKTRWNESVYLRIKLTNALAWKLSANYLRIEGDDKLTTYAPRRYRNLSFRNDIYSFESSLNYYLYTSAKPTGIYRKTNTFITVYALAGIGVFYHNPKTLYQGQWVALQPLKTENVAYSRVAMCVPLGVGAFVTLYERRRAHRIGIEICWRYTNTDYLDDVSGSYVNPSTLSSKDAAKLSNRNPELTQQPEGYAQNYGWWDDGKGNNLNQAPRGNPKDKDSYFSVNITYGMAMKYQYRNSKFRRKVRKILI